MAQEISLGWTHAGSSLWTCFHNRNQSREGRRAWCRHSKCLARTGRGRYGNMAKGVRVFHLRDHWLRQDELCRFWKVQARWNLYAYHYCFDCLLWGASIVPLEFLLRSLILSCDQRRTSSISWRILHSLWHRGHYCHFFRNTDVNRVIEQWLQPSHSHSGQLTI